MTAAALLLWRDFVRDPARRLWTEDSGCGEWGCCGSPLEARAFLEGVLRGMSRRRSRELRAVVDALDDAY
ncbi:MULTISPECIES: hypothetical protein [Streptomyces]|uniref:Uncharacterized protein n=1 Tax=Streptomyces ramulosus TaxID=47762 RepID=A0ABW1FGJ6_9ACTN